MSSRKRNHVIEEFIEIYKSEPCLWRMKSNEYHDREKKKAAYHRLVIKLKELEPDATKTTVVKKINNLRSNSRKEKKKHDVSMKSGASTYTSKLWYVDLFDFLGDQDIPVSSVSNLDDEDGREFDEVTVETGEKEASTTSTPAQNLHLRKRHRTSLENKEKRKLDTPHDSLASKDEKWEVIGKSLGLQLKELIPDQQDIAQKLIAEIIFYGKRRRLTDYAAIDLNPHITNNFSIHYSSPSYSNSQNPNFSTHSPASSS